MPRSRKATVTTRRRPKTTRGASAWPPRRATLERPQDLRGLLRRCHNRLHGRGSESDEEDLTLDMVRLILAKARDENMPDGPCLFRCAPEEYADEAGRARAAARIHELFEAVKREHGDVFSAHERISVGPRALCDVAVELQRFRLSPRPGEDTGDDVIGQAYEEYTATHMKRKRGQFFTNPLVTDLLVRMLDPNERDTVLDPAGGSGGFLGAALRHVRSRVRADARDQAEAATRLTAFGARLFMSDISRRLVKVARAAMILGGARPGGVVQGDALGPFASMDPALTEQAGRGAPTVILTNPPFAGVGEGRVSQPDILQQFECGRRPSGEPVREGAPPELLFFERCVDWLAPGGRLGIVLPKSVLDTSTFLPARRLLFERCDLLAVINCHRHTFQPHTGVRTCLLVVRKRAPNDTRTRTRPPPPIFMAISHKVGQDSEGKPVLRRDPQGKELEGVLDEDLGAIAEAYKAHVAGTLQDTERWFRIDPARVLEDANNSTLRINPQAFLPRLNETLREVVRMDERPGWSVVPLAALAPDLQVFKGPRLRSEPLIVEGPAVDVDVETDGGAPPTIEPYFTPSAIQQQKSDSVKYLDTARASERQRRVIEAIRVARGDILISRSGSVGRVSMVGSRHHRAIVSDDMIRVRTGDEFARHYLYAFLQTRHAQDQLLRNEYGAIQQHIEPQHVRDVLVPIPDDRARVADVTRSVAAQVKHSDALARARERAGKHLRAHLEALSGE